MASNKKNERLKSLKKNIKKLRGHSQLLYWLFVLEIPENSSKNVSLPEACGLTKYRPHHAVSLLQFSKNFEKATSQNHKETLMEMENIKEKLSFDLWLSLLDMKVTPNHRFIAKATVWNNVCWKRCLSETMFMFVKIHVFLKASVAKLYSGLRRYFVKKRKIGLFCLIANSRILQSCFCQQPY